MKICSDCGKDFPNDTKLYPSSTTAGVYVCKKCYEAATEAMTKKWECEVCAKKFDSSVKQWKHRRVPGGLVCPTCIKTLPKDKTEFVKHDQEKIRLDLIPPSLQKAVATILTYGAIKYDDRNWEKGTKWSRIFGSLMRHLLAFYSGEDDDPESGLPHLWHAACNITFLIEFQEARIGEDDRVLHDYIDRDEMIAAAFEKAKELFSEST